MSHNYTNKKRGNCLCVFNGQRKKINSRNVFHSPSIFHTHPGTREKWHSIFEKKNPFSHYFPCLLTLLLLITTEGTFSNVCWCVVSYNYGFTEISVCALICVPLHLHIMVKSFLTFSPDKAQF